jgi:hypothetical protein
MPVPLFLQAKTEADSKARALKSHHIWGIQLFVSLKRILADKSRVEINQALHDARGCIEQRSLHIPQDRIVLLTKLNQLQKELLGS